MVFDVDTEGETIWTTIDQMAKLFGVSRRSIEIHLKNIYAEGELFEGGSAEVETTARAEGEVGAKTETEVRTRVRAEAEAGTEIEARARAETENKTGVKTEIGTRPSVEAGAGRRTAKKIFVVRTEGKRKVRREVNVYNLDAIISVGYRVNSKKATNFRIWATSVLRKYVVSGVAVNARRLEELTERREAKKLAEVENMMAIVRRLTTRNELDAGEANGILEVISKYAGSFETLKEYDDRKIDLRFMNPEQTERELTIEMCKNAVSQLRSSVKGGELFGKERGGSFNGSLMAVFQSFEKKEVYPSISEKAANLLYFIVKDHPFYDGNKRIGALLFILFLTINNFHLSKNGETKISDRALTAITLLIAESEPKEKELIVNLVCKLLE
ncbi:MAG: virulence protein RhuM/Fic/DOC family protein [Candidatus Saccharibacteria bacterium]|nr:virulence protein RhuM/Fic/DOC family protein [Candidatus Saccharibacteria bacterium]